MPHPPPQKRQWAAIRLLNSGRIPIRLWNELDLGRTIQSLYVNPGFSPIDQQCLKIGKGKKWNSVFSCQRHALSTSFDICVVTYRVTNFLPKLVDMLLFSTEKTDFSIFGFPYFRVLPRDPQLECYFPSGCSGWDLLSLHGSQRTQMCNNKASWAQEWGRDTACKIHTARSIYTTSGWAVWSHTSGFPWKCQAGWSHPTWYTPIFHDFGRAGESIAVEWLCSCCCCRCHHPCRYCHSDEYHIPKTKHILKYMKVKLLVPKINTHKWAALLLPLPPYNKPCSC